MILAALTLLAANIDNASLYFTDKQDRGYYLIEGSQRRIDSRTFQAWVAFDRVYEGRPVIVTSLKRIDCHSSTWRQIALVVNYADTGDELHTIPERVTHHIAPSTMADALRKRLCKDWQVIQRKGRADDFLSRILGL